MTPIHTMNGCDMWLDTEADAQGDPGYYWQQHFNMIKSDQRYHNESDAVNAMCSREVTFNGNVDGKM